MAGPNASPAGDPTRGLDKLPDSLRDMDLKKQIRKPKSASVSEEIIEGVTHDSIASYVEATNRRTLAALGAPRSHWISRLFRRDR